MKVTFVNVGQGDGIHIQTPSGKNYLIDGGDTSDENNPPELDDPSQDFCPMVRYLLDRDIRTIDMMLMSGKDHDHSAGLDAVLGTSTTVNGSNVFSVKSLVFTSSNTTPDAITNLTLHPETALVKVSAGTRLDDLAALAGVWDPALEGLIMNPFVSSAIATNDNSIVLRLQYGEVGFLFTGDVETGAEAQLVAAFSDELESTVLKVAHHGSRTSSTASFLSAVKPTLAVISCAQREFGLPDQDVIDRLKEMTAGAVMRTDRSGHITVATPGIGYSVSTTLHDSDVRSVSDSPSVHAYPNPAPGKNSPAQATIVYELNGLADDVRVAVYSLSGELVRSWESSPKLIGRNDVSWDLKNGEGDDVVSGLYIVQVEARAGGGTQSGRAKLAVLR